MLAARFRNASYYCGGLAALALVSAKHRLRGYSTPTSFDASEWEKSRQHVLSIVEDYHRHAHVAERPFVFEGARVLELGPGATLGTGVLLFGLGIRSYHAIDAFPLSSATPPDFYESLTESALPDMLDRDKIIHAATALRARDAATIDYSFDGNFDIGRLTAGRQYDLIVSNAAFEHFDDIDAVIRGLSHCAAPGAMFMAMVDYQTHSRFLRERDPNNIYRFGDTLYRALTFPGQPNRRRPRHYTESLAQHGWVNISPRSVATASDSYKDWSRTGLAPEFRIDDSDMDVLTGVIVAERAR